MQAVVDIGPPTKRHSNCISLVGASSFYLLTEKALPSFYLLTEKALPRTFNWQFGIVLSFFVISLRELCHQLFLPVLLIGSLVLFCLSL